VLDWVITHRERFKPSRLAGGIVDPVKRISENTREIDEIKPLLTRRLSAAFPLIVEKTGTKPFDFEELELEIAAHGDGAHFTVHRDIPVGAGSKPLGGDSKAGLDRIVSAVYYFHREPKGFSGGALRLHRFGSDGAPGDYLDVEPEQNSLLAFPSWATHEVLTVRCPSDAFEDYRYAVNCWFCRTVR
jgi:SM-20-related protein